jgi:type 1 glutamine amidotransferase/HEAT repeat protein
MLLARLFFPVLAVLLAFTPVLPVDAAERAVRVLILSGQNNHDWKATTPKLISILEPGGRFALEVTEEPEKLTEATLAKFDVLLSNWNSFGLKNGDWPETARQAYVKFVREGRGVVIVHAGSSSFNNWEDYHKIAGAAWGEATGHGPVHEFEVKIVDREHPITRGLGAFQIRDELWHRAWSIAERHVLATAFSAKDKGGSGADEPVAFTTAFGKGRCFTLLLGHNAEAMEFAGFRALLRRGTEWAATTKVTLKDSTAQVEGQVDTLLAEAAQYKFGDSRNSLAAMERIVATASRDPGSKPQVAAKLASMLSGNGTTDAKRFFCTQLSLVGSAAEVPAVAKHLTDPNLGYDARLVLERIPGDESLQALRAAVATAVGRDRVGIINSLGAKRSQAAIPELLRLAHDTEPETAAAAVAALGAIGTAPAAAGLKAIDAKAPGALAPVVAEALLGCAEALLREGHHGEAYELLRRLTNPARPRQVRLAASTLLLSAPGARGPVLTALQSDDAVVRGAAVRAMRAASDAGLLADAAGVLSKQAPDVQVQLLTLFAERPQPACLPAVVGALQSGEPDVRKTALGAIGTLGDAATVPTLAAFFETANPEDKALAVDALTRLPGSGVDEALAAALKDAPPKVGRELMRALVARGGGLAPAVLLAQLDSPDAQLRREAATGLSQLGNATAIGPLLKKLETAPSAEAGPLQSAISELCKREGSGKLVRDALVAASPSTQPLLLEVLAGIGDADALEAVTRRIDSSSEPVRACAIRLLANWPEPSALGPLLGLAGLTTDAKTRALAFRGAARLAPLVKDIPAEDLVPALANASADAAVPEQKALLAAYAEMPSVPALKAAAAQLKNPAVSDEAVLAVFKILEQLDREHRAEARPVIETLKQVCKGQDQLASIEGLSLKFGDLKNLSLGATATNTDGLAPDGQGGPAPLAIDGNSETYWDEVDAKKLYSMRVGLKQPARVGVLRILGWQQHNYAPRDFEVVCDGTVVKKIENAQYQKNWLTVIVPPTRCTTVELRITGYYGSSPAIRELEVYGE